MTTVDVTISDRRLSIEVCEVWDFVRDIHSYQVHVADKQAYQRHPIGKYKTKEIAEQKAREWINGTKNDKITNN